MKDYSIIKDITLKEYFQYKGWYKVSGKAREFAIRCGVSDAYISKLINNQYISMDSQTETFKRIADVVAIDGFNLMKGDILGDANNRILKENDRLAKKVKKLEKENEMLRLELEQFNELKKLCKKIASK